MNAETPRRIQARRGFSISYKGKTLLSVIDPVAQAERVVGVLPVFRQTLYLCASPLFGYGLRALLDRMAPHSVILCLETDPELLRLALAEIPEELQSDPRLRISGAATAAAVCAFVRKEFGPRRFRRVVLVKMNGGFALDSEAYSDMETALRDDIALEWSNALTLVKLGRRYALNAVRNLALLPISRPLGANAFAGAPILVLGAGPSLDSIADRIKQDRKYRVVCVDTALMPLLARGIEPDLVVVLEAQHWNLRDFMTSARARTPVAMDLSALPRTAFVTQGERYLFSVPWAPLRLIDRLNEHRLRPPEIPPLGSVGLAAVAVALQAGTGPVVTAGLDFSYDIGAYHARSAPSRLDRLLKTDRMKSLIDPAPAFRAGVVEAQGKGPGRLRTDPALRGYRNLFEREFSLTSRLFDAGDRGLPLGVPCLTPQEAVSMLEGAGNSTNSSSSNEISIWVADRVESFIDDEIAKLKAIRDTLTGDESGTDLEVLVDDCDYLWAHFPECAGADGDRPKLSDLAFTKRVRAEIDPFAKAFTLAKAELKLT